MQNKAKWFFYQELSALFLRETGGVPYFALCNVVVTASGGSIQCHQCQLSAADRTLEQGPTNYTETGSSTFTATTGATFSTQGSR